MPARRPQRYQLTDKELTALRALHERPGGLSDLAIGVKLAGKTRVERATLIRSGRAVASALARHGLAIRIDLPKGWPIFKITQPGKDAIAYYDRRTRHPRPARG